MPDNQPPLLPRTLELGGYRWERLKNKPFGHMYNSKGECIGRGVPYKEALELLTPTPLCILPASPVTRSAEVEAAFEWLDTKEVTPEYYASKIFAHIAQLEARQPKPQSDEGLAQEIFKALHGYVPSPAERKKVHTLLALFRQAPVPTSGAVEVAHNCLAMLPVLFKDEKEYEVHVTQAAAIIQQAINAGITTPVSDDAKEWADTMLGEWVKEVEPLHFKRCAYFIQEAMKHAKATQPPAADGKLEALRTEIEQYVFRSFVGAMDEIMAGGVMCPANDADRAYNEAGKRANRILNSYAKGKGLLQPKFPALAQPASGGGE